MRRTPRVLLIDVTDLELQWRSARRGSISGEARKLLHGSGDPQVRCKHASLVFPYSSVSLFEDAVPHSVLLRSPTSPAALLDQVSGQTRCQLKVYAPWLTGSLAAAASLTCGACPVPFSRPLWSCTTDDAWSNAQTAHVAVWATVRLSDVGLDDSGAHHLGGVLTSMGALYQLDISHNTALGPIGAACLADACRQHSQLQFVVFEQATGLAHVPCATPPTATWGPKLAWTRRRDQRERNETEANLASCVLDVHAVRARCVCG